MGWITDLLWGGTHNSALYEGLNDQDRRSQDRRKAHLLERRDHYLKEHDAGKKYINDLGKSETRLNFVLYTIYKLAAEDPKGKVSADTVTNRFIDYLYPGLTANDPPLLRHDIPRFKGSKIIQEIVPGIFGEAFWKLYAERKATEEKEERAKEQKKEADKAALASSPAFVTVHSQIFSHRKTTEFTSLQAAHDAVWKGLYIPQMSTVVCEAYDSERARIRVFTTMTDTNGDLGGINYFTDWRPGPNQSNPSGHLKLGK